MRNKLICRKQLIEKDIPCPELYGPGDEGRVDNENTLVISRPHHHSQGKDFVVLKNPGNMTFSEPGRYFQRMIPKKAEYRVHVIYNKVLLVQEKVGENKDEYNWNHDKGFVFEVCRWSNIPRGLCPLAVKALDACKGTMGAVDILEDPDGKFHVLEINSGPGVYDYTGEKYGKVLNWMFNNPDKTEFVFKGKYIIREEDML